MFETSVAKIMKSFTATIAKLEAHAETMANRAAAHQAASARAATASTDCQVERAKALNVAAKLNALLED